MTNKPLIATESLSWQEILSNCIRDPEELFSRLQLPQAQLESARRASALFPLRAPLPFVDRITKGDINDPLLKQILPIGDELLAAPGFSHDPLQEMASNPAPGLIHKYQGRVLLIVSPNCAVNCRYCFRRHFPYNDNKPSRKAWQQALDYIADDHSISEVIYSGGDPLAASDAQLRWLTDQIEAIPHIRRLRIHTRLPIMIPQRVNSSLLEMLETTRLQTVMVIHSNHPNELDSQVAQALDELDRIGVVLLNQTVLLKGINDCPETLSTLSERLFECKVLPYYLHLLDKVAGASHFDLTEERAQQLVSQLLTRLPGYLVPKLVREVAGAQSKTPISVIL